MSKTTTASLADAAADSDVVTSICERFAGVSGFC